MFTWICPECGREVPPSYTECPDCAEKRKSSAASAAVEMTGPQSQPQSPAPAATPVTPASSPYLRIPELAPPPAPPRSAMPIWMMSLVFALAFGGIVAVAYFGIQFFKKEPATAQTASATPMETKAAPSSTPANANPLLRQIEVGGLRLTQNKAQKTEVRFLVVNHSGAEIPDLAATVDLQARTSKKDEEAVGSFSFKIPVLAPYESKEVTTLVNTKLKVYELPDWQNLDLRLQITSPK